MVIITTILVAIALIVTSTNPIALVRDNFQIGRSQAQVMGVSEENDVAPVATTTAAVELKVESLPEEKTMEPVLKSVYQKAPEVSASSAIVVDVFSGKVLFSKNIDAQSSIASITKLITALVALDHEPDFEREYVMPNSDRREGGRINLFLGDKITIKDLFNASLVGSDNTATIALVHALDFSEADFVIKMNEQATALGLKNTVFVDPIGLSSNNKSTAEEVAKIAAAAFLQDKIRQTVTQNSYVLKTKQGKTRVIESTDDLLSEKKNYTILGGKTGYLGSAGFCFTGKFTQNEHEVISVVLGSTGVDARFIDTDALVNWVYNNYAWPQ
jgi:D-alanyl-D-alanine endopeptidase (penicillin-binding protein 7)